MISVAWFGSGIIVPLLSDDVSHDSVRALVYGMVGSLGFLWLAVKATGVK